MLRFSAGITGKHFLSLVLFSLVANFAWAQSETATVSGQIVDSSGLIITGAQVKLVDIDRDTSTAVSTNNTGLYTFSSVRPGRYRMEISAVGFRTVNVTGLTLNVQDHLEQNFRLVIGSVSESITVEGGTPLVDTESATVSTVVDRNFAENLPMNGRSFQTLIQLTPGVVLSPSNVGDSGQFNINGQRGTSNYWMVDGVSGNIGMTSGGIQGNGLGGALGSFSASGGTNSLVSVDAMQEFRIQTSTYAPEFGRVPGGQISIVTRSGTNQYHGTAFDYLRNDVLDAGNWFNGYINNPPLAKAKERQNDFGGTFGGPLLKGRTFFFFSYEGLRLRLPQTAFTTVPDLSARQNAASAMQPYLIAFPLPNGADDVANGIAQFSASYSNPARLDAYSLRVDHKVKNSSTLFARYNYSPSESVNRGGSLGLEALSEIDSARITTQTATVGASSLISPTLGNDLRFNYSSTNSSSSGRLDDFDGAVAPQVLPFPSPFTIRNAFFFLDISSLTNGAFGPGFANRNLQRQINVVDNLSVQRTSHALKFGIDFRRLFPSIAPGLYGQKVFFSDVSSAAAGNSEFGDVGSAAGVTLQFLNLGAFAQDTWRVVPRLTLTYGIRWDVDFAPSSLSGPSIPSVSGYDLSDFSQLAIAPAGTAPFKTTYGNVAPRLGVAYQIHGSPTLGTVLRGGFGVFYDLVSSEVGNVLGGTGAPFNAFNVLTGTFPFPPGSVTPPQIPPTATLAQPIYVFNPSLKLPYTLEWNVALEQMLGRQESLSASYVGAAGKRLLQTTGVSGPASNPGVSGDFVDNTAYSDYNALQIQFQRRLVSGFQALASYTWAHSIDSGSAASIFSVSNVNTPGNSNGNRASSDFDIRNAVNAALTYDVPTLTANAATNRVLKGWSIENVVQARSAPPVDISDGTFFLHLLNNGVSADVRPDLVPGKPLYLFGVECGQAPPTGFGVACPGGKGFNPNAFMSPPVDPNNPLVPLRQGNTPRNFLRGFGATQWDLAIHRNFLIHESLRLQFRAELFNVLNHPNFGQPSGQFGIGGFGLATQILAQYLNGGSSGSSNSGGGALSPLYQLGGPRSIQLALKLDF